MARTCLSCNADRIGDNTDHLRRNRDQSRCNSDGDRSNKGGGAVIAIKSAATAKKSSVRDHAPDDDDPDTLTRDDCNAHEEAVCPDDEEAERCAAS